MVIIMNSKKIRKVSRLERITDDYNMLVGGYKDSQSVSVGFKRQYFEQYSIYDKNIECRSVSH